MIKFILFNILLLFSFDIYSYLSFPANNLKSIKWQKKNDNNIIIPLVFNPRNNSTTENVAISILQNSINQWTNIVDINFQLTNSTSHGDISHESNNIYFSSDSDLLGAAILATTVISYSETFGVIHNANIIINDNFNFSSDVSQANYLGNIISHELGHLLGLSHSQVQYSTLFYSLRRGQYIPHTDDEAGVRDIYNKNQQYGKIRGKIIGGKNTNDHISILAAHVQAISTNTGRVVIGTFSDEEGNFLLDGLPKDDSYYLYIQPPTYDVSTFPKLYSEIKRDFCLENKDYRGSFYEGCSSDGLGYPLAVKLDDDNMDVDVGNITIRCSINTPLSYLENRDTNFSLDVNDGNSNIGNAFVGYFSNLQIENNNNDIISVDLTDYTPSNSNTYLEIKLISHDLLSKVVFNMSIEDNNSNIYSTGPTVDVEGNPNLNLLQRIPIDSNNISNNLFTITISPEKFSNYLSSQTRFKFIDYFALDSYYRENMIFYLLIVSISQKNADNTYTTISTANYRPLTDNIQCIDAPNSYRVLFSLKGDRRLRYGSNDDEDTGASCGSIGINNQGPPQGGLLWLVFGFFLAVFSMGIIEKKLLT